MERDLRETCNCGDSRARRPTFSPEQLRPVVSAATALAGIGCGADGRNEHCDAALHRLLDGLREWLVQRPAFSLALETALACAPCQAHPWRYQTMIDSPLLRAGLLTLFRFAPIPLHDHPGACGAQRVLFGRVQIERYDHSAGAGQSPRVVWLERTAEQDFTSGGSASFHRGSGNLHQLKSLTARSVLLSVLIRPHQDGGRAWYFPVNGFLPSERGLYTRVKNHPRRTTLGAPHR